MLWIIELKGLFDLHEDIVKSPAVHNLLKVAPQVSYNYDRHKLVRAGKKWRAEIYKKKKGKKTKSFAGHLLWLVLPTPLMHFRQVHMKKKWLNNAVLWQIFILFF